MLPLLTHWKQHPFLLKFGHTRWFLNNLHSMSCMHRWPSLQTRLWPSLSATGFLLLIVHQTFSPPEVSKNSYTLYLFWFLSFALMNIYHLIRNSHLWGLMEHGPWTFCGNKSSDAYVLNFKWWHLHIAYTIFPYTINHLSITYALNAMWIVAMPYGVKNNSKEKFAHV